MSDFFGLFSDDKSQNTDNENSQTNMSNQGSDTGSSTQDTQTNMSNQGNDTSSSTQDTQTNMSNQGNDTSSSTQDTQANTSNQGNDTGSSTQDTQTDGSLQLHKEELDITKNNVDAGQVVISKDVVEEQRTIDVPVMHEEVVIKRTSLNNQRSDGSTISQESITIPVSQEQVEVNKYTVATEEISASKRQVEDTQQVQETLRREQAHVDTTGSVNIVSDGSGFNDINNS
jgi:uncharacterized protein (TIGR02271 family)